MAAQVGTSLQIDHISPNLTNLYKSQQLENTLACSQASLLTASCKTCQAYGIIDMEEEHNAGHSSYKTAQQM